MRRATMFLYAAAVLGMAKLKTRFILTIGETPKIRKLFSRFSIETAR